MRRPRVQRPRSLSITGLFRRNFFPDSTSTANPSTIIGYGGPGSPSTNNRTLQEITFDWLQTFWKSPKFGPLQYYTRYSYVTRAPGAGALSSNWRNCWRSQDGHAEHAWNGHERHSRERAANADGRRGRNDPFSEAGARCDARDGCACGRPLSNGNPALGYPSVAPHWRRRAKHLD